ncbi:unnamed protein product [Polarella glacialis]|uniref:EF-hand domain-containing protein n=1 Tax=Polarella glacialis TaxID=89957 RepID=A0A813EK97_POLGL|nr:unnamed protein product [Polarella glacialis]CAE8667449.1 unnamed protein product [Polarella glacialis]
MAAEAANSKNDLSERFGADNDSSQGSSGSSFKMDQSLSTSQSAKALLEQRRGVRSSTPVLKDASLSVEARFRAEVLEILAKLDERLDKLTSQVELFPSLLPSKSATYVEVAAGLVQNTSLINAGKKDLRQVAFGPIASEDHTNAQSLPEGTSFTDVPDCPDSNRSGMEAVPSCSVPSCFKTEDFLISKDFLQETEVHLEHDSWFDKQQVPVSLPMDEDCRLHCNGDQQLTSHAEEFDLPNPRASKVRTSITSEEVVRSAMAMLKRSRSLLLSNELSHMSRKTRTRTVVEKKVWSFLEYPDLKSGSRHLTRLMCLAILCGTAIPVLQTIRPPPFDVFTMGILGAVLDGVFSLEVAIRFWACPNRMFFFLNGFNIIDLIASVCPLLAQTATGGIMPLDEAAMNEQNWLMILICSIPILRLLKLLRRFESFHLFLQAFRLAVEAMPVLIYNLVVLVLFFASIIYIAEPKGGIDGIDTFPRALWFTIVTVGTVGYGDVTLQSSAGTVAAAMLIIVSALYMAIPLGIVGKAFGIVWDDRDRLLLMHRTRLRFLSGGYRAQDIPEMFFSFDMDHNGSLCLPEFVNMMRQMEIDVSGGRVLQLFKAFDEDGSGGIDDREFVRTLFPNAYAEIYGADADDEESIAAQSDHYCILQTD